MPTALSQAHAHAMAALHGATEGIHYGPAPLLLDNASRVVVDEGVAYLTYPAQSANPLDWPAADCFVLAYAARQYLLTEFPGLVGDVSLGAVHIPSQVGEHRLGTSHVAAWVAFAGGQSAAVDLTPLAADFLNPRHTAVRLVNGNIASQVEVAGAFVDTIEVIGIPDAHLGIL